jgi:hypothetical protein
MCTLGVGCCLSANDNACSCALFSADLVEKEAAEEALSRYAEVSSLQSWFGHVL